MNRILVVYIATGMYNDMWDGFINSLHNFCPGVQKDVVVFTDCPPNYEIDSYAPNVSVVQIETIWHQPWPIVAEMKFHYINHAFMSASHFEDYTHVFYFNSNIEFVTEIDAECVLTKKAIAAVNCGWDYLGHNPLKFTYGKPVDPKSKAHIPTNEYTYVQSSMMGGHVVSYISLVRKCMDMIEYDLAHNLIPCFHDESYWNKVVYDNPDLVTILDGDYNMDKLHAEEWGHPNAKIVMRDSSKTQYKYKDRFHE